MRRLHVSALIVILTGTALAAACSSDGAVTGAAEPDTDTASSAASADEATTSESDEVLHFAMPPGTDDPDVILQAEEMAATIAAATGREVEIANPADYMAVVEAIRGGFVDVAFMSQFSTALAIETGAVEPLIVWEAEQEPAAYCLVLDESPITTIDDLRGGEIAFVDPGSTTGHFMPRSLLAEEGLVYDEDYRATFAGSHDTAMLALLNGGVDMACTARQLYGIFLNSGLFEEGQLRIVAETDPIPIGVSIVVRPDLDEATRELLTAELPDLVMADPLLAGLLGGSDDYIVNPGTDVYAPLLAVAEAADLNLDDLR